MPKIIAIVSGGMDSVTMAHHLAQQGNEVHLLSVDYGQRHRKEHTFAAAAADRLGAVHQVADLRAVGAMFRGSSLTDPTVDVPEQTWNGYGESPNIVPNRNALLLAVAFAIAVVEKAEAVAIGSIAGDVASVPDSTPEFLESFIAMERLATKGYAHPDLALLAPLSGMAKSGVVLLGEKLGVPWTSTWTCFRGEETHCGRCAPCWERQEAFHEAGVEDPTGYQTTTPQEDRS
ncbi:7-cyano-7-deazaguanine synthase [Streptomyces blastmyceticus]|uniref:7-cyano-7-deazaguanine synthase n=1 Tax=Streptomyces blastmyceticus TaxID=68180 RepID=A0ABN0Y2Q4_9ACTN